MLKKGIFKYFSVTVLLVLLGSYTASQVFQQEGQKEEVLLSLIMQGLQVNHFNPVDINNDFSEKAFDLYLKRMDYTKRILTEDDVDRLKKYREEIDDHLKNGNFAFFNESLAIINKRTTQAEKYYKEILAKPFNYEKDESIEMDPEKLDWASDDAELKERWRKYLKFQTLTRIVNRMEAQEKALADKDTIVEVKSFAAIEEEARNAVMKSQEEVFTRLARLERGDWLAIYINSIVNTFDPHTEYFPPKDKENFDIAMSGQLEGIGAQLVEKSGYIEVSQIVPGSASWKQGELKAGDVILSVGEGDAEPVDIVGMRLDKAVQLIRGKKGTQVVLTVKKIDGTIAEIPIVRDVVILEETFAKSAVINNKNSNFKIGYIQLPSFYADFSGGGGRSSGKDVKNEIEKLKKENIQGLVLDLRNNGGGSLQDVVEMAGLFIEQGPIVQVKARNGKPYILSDKDPSIQWNGPLVILVNEFSASASEIFAAAMQDYNRGIVIGSENTFGKGTVQQFIELDQIINKQYSDLKPLGSLKLTTQKFYRINGDATQLKGVASDIVIPDAYAYIPIGEKELEYAMPFSSIEPVKYKKWNATYGNVVDKSRDRIDDNNIFEIIDENAKRLHEQSEETKYSLNLKKYKEHRAEAEARAERYNDIEKSIEQLQVKYLREAVVGTEDDESSLVRAEAFEERLKKDSYLFEAMHILNDLQ